MIDPVVTSRLTRHYPAMQGLVFLPIWLGLGAVTVLNGLGWTRTSSWEETAILFISFAAAVPFAYYYKRRFGTVRPVSGAQLPTLAAGAAVVALALQFVAVANRFPVEPLLLFASGFFLVIGLIDHGYRKHWVIPAVACFLLSIRAFVPLERQTSHIMFGVFYAGTVSLACIRDHVLLVRGFRELQA